MKANICKCNNCDTLLIDENPQVGANQLIVPDSTPGLIRMKEPEACGGGEFWACPNCKTDSFLADLN
jgi:hypothetical protein